MPFAVPITNITLLMLCYSLNCWVSQLHYVICLVIINEFWCLFGAIQIKFNLRRDTLHLFRDPRETEIEKVVSFCLYCKVQLRLIGVSFVLQPFGRSVRQLNLPVCNNYHIMRVMQHDIVSKSAVRFWLAVAVM